MANPVYHPRRYPVHDQNGRGTKGQVWGGECNRTACESSDATYYNVATFAYYCACCAESINEFPTQGIRPCMAVEGQLTLAEMDGMAKMATTSLLRHGVTK